MSGPAEEQHGSHHASLHIVQHSSLGLTAAKLASTDMQCWLGWRCEAASTVAMSMCRVLPSSTCRVSEAAVTEYLSHLVDITHTKDGIVLCCKGLMLLRSLKWLVKRTDIMSEQPGCITPSSGRVRTQHLQLAPKLALFTADAVHDLGDVLEVALQLRLELAAARPLPQPPLVEGHRARLLQRLAVHLRMRITWRSVGVLPCILSQDPGCKLRLSCAMPTAPAAPVLHASMHLQ